MVRIRERVAVNPESESKAALVRLLKNSVQRASLLLNRSLAEER